MPSPVQSKPEPAPANLSDWADLAARLTVALHLTAPPVALTFRSAESPAHRAPAAEPAFPLAPVNEHGRTGSAAAGCVFWIKGAEGAVTTHAVDHANCSVGSVTHGFRTREEVVANDDVHDLLASGWIDQSGFMSLPVVPTRTESVVYAPLASLTAAPDVVLIRTNARGLMTIKDAVPDLPVEGKPQCHVVAMAKEHGKVAASVGCALSRARTGMRVDETTCVFPAAGLPALVSDIESHAALDSSMARYAGEDARRFAGLPVTGA
jgi:uncharacterized protein (DUF169 family)